MVMVDGNLVSDLFSLLCCVKTNFSVSYDVPYSVFFWEMAKNINMDPSAPIQDMGGKEDTENSHACEHSCGVMNSVL